MPNKSATVAGKFQVNNKLVHEPRASCASRVTSSEPAVAAILVTNKAGVVYNALDSSEPTLLISTKPPPHVLTSKGPEAPIVRAVLAGGAPA